MAQLDNCRDSIITGLYCAKYFNMRFVIVGARSAVYMHGNGMSVAEAWAKAKGDPNGYISSVRAADVWAANLILMNLTFGDSSEVGTAIATLNRCRSGNITSPVTSNDVASLRSVYSDAELVTPEIRDAMLTIEQIRSRYPLLKYYFSENTDHYNLYIKAVNANTATLA